MIIEPTSLLYARESGSKVRLSMLAEDDNGCRKGLTVIRIVPQAHDQTGARESRPDIFLGDAAIGTLDPLERRGEREQSQFAAVSGSGVLSGGALICAFTLGDNVEPTKFLNAMSGFGIADNAELAGAPVSVLGEGLVGSLLDELTYTTLGCAHVYPLLRVRRSRRDLATGKTPTRSGALVTAEPNKLIGIIVSVDEDLSHYTVAPLSDVLSWHRLRLPRSPWPMWPGHKPTRPASRTADTWKAPDGIDFRLLELAR